MNDADYLSLIVAVIALVALFDHFSSKRYKTVLLGLGSVSLLDHRFAWLMLLVAVAVQFRAGSFGF